MPGVGKDKLTSLPVVADDKSRSVVNGVASAVQEGLIQIPDEVRLVPMVRMKPKGVAEPDRGVADNVAVASDICEGDSRDRALAAIGQVVEIALRLARAARDGMRPASRPGSSAL